MAPVRDPLSDESVLNVGRILWEQNAGRLWSNIDSTARVLMAYYHPGAAWRAADYLLQPMQPSDAHRARP